MIIKNPNQKKLILIYTSDFSGCSHVRLRYLANYINAINDQGFIAIVSPIPIMDIGILANTAAIIWQKPNDQNHLNVLRQYASIKAKFGFKLIYEIDDIFFRSPWEDQYDGISVPDYNPSRSMNPNRPEESPFMSEIVSYFDIIMCSTDYLGKCFSQRYKISSVRTIKNTVPRYLWNKAYKKPIDRDIDKPKILYSGSQTHYTQNIPERKPSPMEPNGFPGIVGKLGDWNTNLKDWLIENVKNERINFTVLGAMPYFFEPIRDKIEFIPWANSYSYPDIVQKIDADFQVAPLVSNEFNKCKSALRFYESCIAGNVFLGATFRENQDSPYCEIYPDCKFFNDYTCSKFDEIFQKLCKKDNYNEVLSWQYRYIDNYIMENEKYLNQFLSMLV